MQSPKQLAQNRPAESGGAVGGAVVALLLAFGVSDPHYIAAAGIIAGYAPAVITWIVELVRG